MLLQQLIHCRAQGLLSDDDILELVPILDNAIAAQIENPPKSWTAILDWAMDPETYTQRVADKSAKVVPLKRTGKPA